MPFSSKAQQGFLFANHPAVAKEFAAATTPAQYQSMPKRVGGGGPKLPSTLLSSRTAYDAPKWSTNPWGEMIKRKGVKNLRNTGF